LTVASTAFVKRSEWERVRGRKVWVGEGRCMGREEE